MGLIAFAVGYTSIERYANRDKPNIEKMLAGSIEEKAAIENDVSWLRHENSLQAGDLAFMMKPRRKFEP
jgi:hypothetical protein